MASSVRREGGTLGIAAVLVGGGALGGHLAPSRDVPAPSPSPALARARAEPSPQDLERLFARVREMRDRALALHDQHAPEFPDSLLDLEGRPLRLADLEGKVWLLHLWSTGCSPCRAELPNLVALYRQWHPLGVEFVSVALDEDAEGVRQLLHEAGVDWRSAVTGADGAWTSAYALYEIPRFVLVGPSGRILDGYPEFRELPAEFTNALHPSLGRSRIR